MKTLHTKSGQKILVDDQSLPVLERYTWHIDSRGYPATNINGRKIRMHKLLLKEAKIVDHINRNKLDNRLENLREATHSQNTLNREAIPTKKACPYKGVHKTASGKWQAMIWYKGKNYGLGSYSTPEEAALVYNSKAQELYGNDAYLNQIA